MAWTDPSGHVWTTGETVTAANMNTYIRLNLQETCPATVTTAGDLAYADAANSMGSRLGIGAAGSSLVSTGSAPIWRAYAVLVGDNNYTAPGSGGPTSYTALNAAGWGTGTNVTVTIQTGTQALVWHGVQSIVMSSFAANDLVSVTYAISGATTLAAADAQAFLFDSLPVSQRHSGMRMTVPTLTAGSNTFTVQAKVENAQDNTQLVYPYIVVQAL